MLSPKNHLWLLAIFAALLPFEYIPSYEIYGLRLRLSLIVGLAIIACGIYFALQKQKSLKIGLTELLIAAWLAWVFIKSIGVEDNKQAIQIVVPLIFYGLLAFSTSIIAKKSYLKKIISGLFIGAGLAVVFGFYQFAANWLGAPEWATGLRPQYSWESFGFPRLQSSALEPLYFSAYLLLPIAVLSSLAIRSRKYRQPIFIGLLMAMLIADILTLSRGGLAALVLQMTILGAYYFRKLNKRTIVYVSAGMLIVIILIFGLISLTARQGQDNDVTYGKKGVDTFVSHLKNFNFFASNTNKSNDDSISQRDQSRTQVKETLNDHADVLVFGAGAGQYQTFVKNNYSNPYLGEPNNLILEQLVQFGIIGLALLLSAGITLFWKLFKAAKNQDWMSSALSIALAVYLLALFLQAQTFTGLALTHLWFAVGLGLFLIKLSGKNKLNEKTT